MFFTILKEESCDIICEALLVKMHDQAELIRVLEDDNADLLEISEELDILKKIRKLFLFFLKKTSYDFKCNLSFEDFEMTHTKIPAYINVILIRQENLRKAMKGSMIPLKKKIERIFGEDEEEGNKKEADILRLDFTKKGDEDE